MAEFIELADEAFLVNSHLLGWWSVCNLFGIVVGNLFPPASGVGPTESLARTPLSEAPASRNCSWLSRVSPCRIIQFHLLCAGNASLGDLDSGTSLAESNSLIANCALRVVIRRTSTGCPEPREARVLTYNLCCEPANSLAVSLFGFVALGIPSPHVD